MVLQYYPSHQITRLIAVYVRYIRQIGTSATVACDTMRARIRMHIHTHLMKTFAEMKVAEDEKAEEKKKQAAEKKNNK